MAICLTHRLLPVRLYVHSIAYHARAHRTVLYVYKAMLLIIKVYVYHVYQIVDIVQAKPMLYV